MLRRGMSLDCLEQRLHPAFCFLQGKHQADDDIAAASVRYAKCFYHPVVKEVLFASEPQLVEAPSYGIEFLPRSGDKDILNLVERVHGRASGFIRPNFLGVV